MPVLPMMAMFSTTSFLDSGYRHSRADHVQRWNHLPAIDKQNRIKLVWVIKLTTRYHEICSQVNDIFERKLKLKVSNGLQSGILENAD